MTPAETFVTDLVTPEAEDDHVLVVQHFGEFDPEWEVLHPETCYPLSQLEDEDQRGPSHRCLVHFLLDSEGEEAFDVVKANPPTPGRWDSVLPDLLPTGRYLCRAWYIVGEGGDLDGIELIEGPVWAGDREGWDKDRTTSVDGLS